MSKGEEGFCPFAYQGQIIDKETGLYYNRFRYYSPEEGTYISQDPIGLEGGIKFYSYVHDPNDWIDPLGLAKIKDEYSSMDEYWKAKHTPTQVTPGITEIIEQKPSSRSNEVYTKVSHYDEYGRMVGQTHYTSHGEPDIHPNPHHHKYDPKTGAAIRNPEDGTKIFPGEFNASTCD